MFSQVVSKEVASQESIHSTNIYLCLLLQDPRDSEVRSIHSCPCKLLGLTLELPLPAQMIFRSRNYSLPHCVPDVVSEVGRFQHVELTVQWEDGKQSL